ncbi:MAG: MGMT family protein [Sulfurovaceae bacterium]|nr:MGMT family protein [Sulfurovaceae bacterium]
MTFRDNCYNLLMQIPKGKVTTYKAIANKLGSKAYRAVGSAMKNNPNAPQVPCHRVVKSDGSIGEYAYGKNKKIKLLKDEGLNIKDGKIVDFTVVFYEF